MKRVFIMLLAVLMLAVPACAALAEAGQTFATDYYTLTIPQDWEINTSDLESEEDYKLLGDLYSPEVPGLVIETGLVHYEDMNDISLWNADEATTKEYIDAVLDELAEDNPKYVKTLNNGGIPFIVVKAEGEDGPYSYIDTMTNGYAVVFYAYVADDKSDTLLPMSDADWAQVESILATFKPAG